MANLKETSTWETGIYQIEENDPVHGGENGITNRPAKQLANRTKYLQDNKVQTTTTISAGNGLTGGGDLSANRSLALGTPSKITATSSNSVTAESHSHAIDKASTTGAGIVQLNDTLTSTSTTQALTANQGKILQDTKANKAGESFTGQITAPTIVVGKNQNIAYPSLGFQSSLTNSRFWSLEPASTGFNILSRSAENVQAGQVIYSLIGRDSGSYQLATTADNVASASKLQTPRTINGVAFDGTQNINIEYLKTVNYWDDKSSSHTQTGFYRANGFILNGQALPALDIHIAHPSRNDNAYARGIGFDYGHTGWRIFTTAWDDTGNYRGAKEVLTELNGVMKSGDTMTGLLRIQAGIYSAIFLKNSATSGLRFETYPQTSGHALGSIYGFADNVESTPVTGKLEFPKKERGSYLLATTADNVASASKLQTPRTINGVAFDGTQNINIEAPLMYRGNANTVEQLDNAKQTGFYLVNNNPTITNLGLYNYGVLYVYQQGNVVHQLYYAHVPNTIGSCATRITWHNDWTRSASWRIIDTPLNNTLTSTSTTQALTANQGKILQDTKANKAGESFTGPITAPTLVLGKNQNIAYPSLSFQSSLTNSRFWSLEPASTGFNILSRSAENVQAGQVIYSLIGRDSGSYQLATTADNVASASKLQTPRQIALTGAVTGNVNFDGSANANIATSLSANTLNDIGLGAFRKSETGYTKLPNGFILQWGVTSSIFDERNETITFPIAFPNAVLSVQLTEKEKTTRQAHATHVVASNVTRTNFEFWINSTLSISTSAYWLAIGY